MDHLFITLVHDSQNRMEMPGFEPGASYMRSKRSTTELHPLHAAGFLL